MQFLFMPMLVIIVVAALLVTFVLIPAGTLVHEVSRFPLLWFKAVKSNLPKAKSHRISYGPHPKQYYLFSPAPNGQPKWLIYFHGGSWRWGKPEYFRSHAQLFNALGYNVIMPSYRPCPAHHYGHIAEDIKSIFSMVREKHPGWRPDKTIAGGMSAGGHLAALLALDTALLPSNTLKHSKLAGFFSLGAPLALDQMPDSFPIRDLAGPREAQLFQAANPINFLPLKPEQKALIIHGEKDGMVPLRAAQQFAMQAKERAPDQVTWKSIENGTHLSIAAWPFEHDETHKILTQWLKSAIIPREGLPQQLKNDS